MRRLPVMKSHCACLKTSVCIILAVWPAKDCRQEDIQLSGRVAVCVHSEPEECSLEEKSIIGGHLIAECVPCVSGFFFRGTLLLTL